MSGAILDYYVQQAAILAGAGTKFKIKFQPGLKEPTFDGRTITLPQLGIECTREDIEQQRAFVYRCTAYGRFGEGFRTPILQAKNPNDKLTQIFHQTDDTRCEKLEALDYAGVYDTLVAAERSSLKMLFKQLSTLDPAVFDDDRASRELAQLAAHTLSNSSWNPSSRDTLDLMAKLYDGTKTGAYLDQMFDADIPDRLLKANKANDAYTIAKEIYDILFKDKNGEGEGTGNHNKPGKGDGKSGQAGTKPGEGDQPGEGEGYGEGVSEEDKRLLKRIMTEYRDFEYKEGGRPNPVVITYENRSKSETRPTESLSEVKVFDFKTKNWPNSRGMYGGKIEDLAPGGSIEIDRASAAFANRVRSLLQIKSQAFYTHGHKKGRLSSKRLYRIAAPTVGDGTWNQRVYKRRHQDKILDVAVAVMIDVSGSMHCAKTAWTYKGCVLLNDVFSKVLHVPTQIACFNTDRNTNIGVLKDYTQPIAQTQIKERFDSIIKHMTGNNDSTALLWAATHLAQRREKRKVLIMMSDGQPSAGGYGDADHQLRYAAKAVEARPDMELYSIGMEYNGVKEFYKNWSEVKTGTDIEEALLKVLSKTIINV